MDLEELLKKAEENYNALAAKIAAGETKYQEQADQLKTLVDQLTAVQNTVVTKEELLELKNELADLELKVQQPSNPKPEVTPESFKAAVVHGVAEYVRSGDKKAVFSDFVNNSVKEQIGMEVKAALNLTNTGEGLESVDEVLSTEIIERAREAYPIIGAVRIRNMPRMLREQVLISFPSVQDGIENVAGSPISETEVQRYAEVVNKVCKINAKPRITDEAMYGSDLDLYDHLLTLLAEEFGRSLAAQVLYGDASDKSMRGILSSSRLDITATTGESWKGTFGAGARSPDFYPAHGTGVDGGLGVDDKSAVDFFIDVVAMLPTAYLNGARWYLNRRVLAAVKKLRDADQRPIFANGYMGEPMSILGYPVVIEDTLPELASDAPFAIFGQLNAAFSMSTGAIDKLLIDPYTVDGNTVVKADKEYYEIVGKNDAIIVCAATTATG